MHLKKPLWSAALKETREPSSEAEPQPQQPSSSMATAVDELVNSLNKQRLYREVTLALRTSLRDARAEFSFLRLRGLRSLLNFLRSVAQSDSTIKPFLPNAIFTGSSSGSGFVSKLVEKRGRRSKMWRV
ncbi:hypothetical protein OIU84_007823 [Salix udensis]|uniref:Uncharacterized protein n=1 Tax=Salix udensis TaxID=889485 RepID=A0AAD6JTP9_9ROSI|nr:hypothetical protein OIU84_007823 [Salix udensis]